MQKKPYKITFFKDIDKQIWCEHLDGYLQQTNRLKTICLTYTKPLTVLFNKIPFCFERGMCIIVVNENV